MTPGIYLKHRKIKQKEAAEALGIKQTTFNHKYLGKRKWTTKEARDWEAWTKGMVSRMEVLYPEGI